MKQKIQGTEKFTTIRVMMAEGPQAEPRRNLSPGLSRHAKDCILHRAIEEMDEWQWKYAKIKALSRLRAEMNRIIQKHRSKRLKELRRDAGRRTRLRK